MKGFKSQEHGASKKRQAEVDELYRRACAGEIRHSNIPRGPEPFPHWHDSPEWAKRTTLTRSRFLAMTPEEFAEWCQWSNCDLAHKQEVLGFFYGQQWPEGLSYCQDWKFAIFAYDGLKRWRCNWPDVLLDTEE